MVIEILRELDSDGNDCELFSVQTDESLDRGCRQFVNQQLVTMVKKKNGKLTMRSFRLIAMLPTIYRLYSETLQQLAGGSAIKKWPQYGHVRGRQAHEVVWMLRRMVEQATEWQIPVFVMDCDVAVAFDHVSHHEIIKATLAMRTLRC